MVHALNKNLCFHPADLMKRCHHFRWSSIKNATFHPVTQKYKERRHTVPSRWNTVQNSAVPFHQTLNNQLAFSYVTKLIYFGTNFLMSAQFHKNYRFFSLIYVLYLKWVRFSARIVQNGELENLWFSQAADLCYLLKPWGRFSCALVEKPVIRFFEAEKSAFHILQISNKFLFMLMCEGAFNCPKAEGNIEK